MPEALRKSAGQRLVSLTCRDMGGTLTTYDDARVHVPASEQQEAGLSALTTLAVSTEITRPIPAIATRLSTATALPTPNRRPATRGRHAAPEEV